MTPNHPLSDNSAMRLYVAGVDEFGPEGYPVVWHKGAPAVKDLVREQASHRCVRCLHPYRVRTGMGEWSPCDKRCHHRGEVRLSYRADDGTEVVGLEHRLATAAGVVVGYGKRVEARYRILTVHHLDGVKGNLRWWNLVALCQRCHLEIQGRVVMDRVWPHEHSAWFKPYVAGYYAWRYLGEEISRQEAEQRIDELLGLEIRQLALETT